MKKFAVQSANKQVSTTPGCVGFFLFCECRESVIWEVQDWSAWSGLLLQELQCVWAEITKQMHAS